MDIQTLKSDTRQWGQQLVITAVFDPTYAGAGCELELAAVFAPNMSGRLVVQEVYMPTPSGWEKVPLEPMVPLTDPLEDAINDPDLVWPQPTPGNEHVYII